jgi:hypothetical protein
MKVVSLFVSAALVSQSSAFTVGGPVRVVRSQSPTQLEAADGLDLVSNSQSIAGAVAAAVAGIGGIFAAIGGKKGEKVEAGKVPKAAPAPLVDISIPYNSAAMLAFQEYSADASLFASFEPLYLEKAVAQVSAKKIARDLEAAMQAKEATVNNVDNKMKALFAKE